MGPGTVDVDVVTTVWVTVAVVSIRVLTVLVVVISEVASTTMVAKTVVLAGQRWCRSQPHEMSLSLSRSQ